jgi:NADPH:quinone reductase-like Zn-dependent oxidoreductase
VASAGRRDFVTSLGADAFIDYRSTPAEQLPGGFDAVVDCVPNLPRAAHRRLLRRGGRYASSLPDAATWTIDPLLNLLGRLDRRAVMVEPRAEAMRELLEYVTQGRLVCRIEEEFKLEDVAAAIERSRAGHVAGKLVIRTA